MSPTILYEDRVDADIDEAVEYYIQINPQLASDFLDQIEIAKDKIRLNPTGFESKYKNIRTLLLERFPYHVYFIIENDFIYILAIIHAQSGTEKIRKITN